MAASMYLKFEDPSIEGSSQAPGHAGEIEILSWNHGFGSPTLNTASDKATHQNLTFTKYIDTSTNELLKHCWGGSPFGQVTLSCYRSDGDNKDQVEYLTIVLQNVVVSNYSISGGAGDVPVENVSLDYGVIQYNYKEYRQGSSSDQILSAKHSFGTVD